MTKKTGKIKADLICLYDETFDESEDLKLFDPNAPWKKTRLPGGSYTLREMLIPVIKAGKTIYTSPGVMEIREICNHEKDTIWDENQAFRQPAGDLRRPLPEALRYENGSLKRNEYGFLIAGNPWAVPRELFRIMHV